MQRSLRKERHDSVFLRIIWVFVPFLLITTGAYMLLLLYAPRPYHPLAPSSLTQTRWNEPVARDTALHEPRIYIPRLGLNLAYGPGQHALRDGLWHRYEDQGNPEKGGNFILAGHRFEIGFTPNETRRRSPLYHIDKVQKGDYIFIDFNGKRYMYEVTRTYKVKPTQVEIESITTEAHMTLYTCTLKGQSDGREVLEATLAQKDVNPARELAVRGQL